MTVSPENPRPVALDHNFPESILKQLAPFLPEIDFYWVRELAERVEAVDPDYPHLPEIDDHELIYEIHRIGFSVMVTGNYKMVNDGRVLVAVEQTRLTLLTIHAAGHDMILSTGVLLRDLVPILKAEVPKGQIFPARSSRITAKRPREYTERRDQDLDQLTQQHGWSYASYARYPADDPLRLV